MCWRLPGLQVTLLDFAPDHAKSYNALVEVIRRNLLLADWCDDAHVEVGGVGHAWSLGVVRWMMGRGACCVRCEAQHTLRVMLYMRACLDSRGMCMAAGFG